MKRPDALASYQWPPSNEVIAERVGIDSRDIIRFDGNVAATPPPSARPAALARALADVNEYDRGRYFTLRAAIADRHDTGCRQ
jgi:histidinol-phosphate/aromatic aminotransferase/cobyric acid decarboxylase-like protein